METTRTLLIDEAERPALVTFLANESDFPRHLLDLYENGSDRYRCFLGWRDDRIVGMLSGSFDSNLNASGNFESFELPPPPHAFLDRLHVSVDERRHGVGRALVLAYAKEAAARGCTFMGGSIDLASNSAGRRAFFESLRFSIRRLDNFGATVEAVLNAPGTQ